MRKLFGKTLEESPRRIRAVAGLLLLWMTGSLAGQDFQITTAVGPDNKLHVQFPADTNFYYYILVRGDDVTSITTPVNMTLATTVGGDVVDPLPVSYSASAFFRVLQVLL